MSFKVSFILIYTQHPDNWGHIGTDSVQSIPHNHSNNLSKLQIYATLLFKIFQDYSAVHWRKPTIISMKIQALHKLALTCTAAYSFIPVSFFPWMHHTIRQDSISGRPISYFPTGVCADYHYPTKLPCSVYTLASDTRLQVPYQQGPSGICLCISRALHRNWNSKSIYWKSLKKKVNWNYKKIWFIWLPASLSGRFVSGI